MASEDNLFKTLVYTYYKVNSYIIFASKEGINLFY